MTPSPKSILLIQTAFIGDIIMSTPLFSMLKKAYPDAEIDVVVNSRYTSILSNNPYIRNVFGFNKSTNKIRNLVKLIHVIRKNRYDLAVSMQIHLSSTLMMVLGGIKKRVGSSRQRLLTHPVTFSPGMHIREKAAMLVRALKDDHYDLQTQLYPSSSDIERAIQYLRNNKHFKLGIAPGSVWETKRWPKEYYIEAISALIREADIYLIGGPDDIALCDEIVKNIPAINIVNTAGKLSLLQSAALIDKMDLLICNDSAPLHMANAMKTPVFAIFGPTVKKFGCYPYQENDKMIEIDLYCRPCSKHGGNICPEGHFRCMKDIMPERVVREVLAFMGEKD
jgi:heptosyltransferase II